LSLQAKEGKQCGVNSVVQMFLLKNNLKRLVTMSAVIENIKVYSMLKTN
jgi:hypothetical protein